MLGPGDDMGRVMAHSTTHPKYLHSNSTSHVWAFGAIAELADNALDAGASRFDINLLQSSQLFVNVKKEKDEKNRKKRKSEMEPSGQWCLTFRDDGKGMSPLELHKMLSFGHCDKDKLVVEGGQAMPIGHYGNGFKSGSMRLGKDALVFTKSEQTQSIGLLSQTFLKQTEAAEVLVPIVSWDNENEEPISVHFSRNTLVVTSVHSSSSLIEAFRANIQAILEYSPYKSVAALKMELNRIRETGTFIVVYNLKKPDLTDDPCEFSLRDESEMGLENDIQLARSMWDEVTVAAGHRLAPTFYSLREYMSILYLNPRMQIWIRGHKVNLRKLEYCLHKPRQYSYRPRAADKSEKVEVTMGFNKFSDKEHFGMMIYHRDRLIKSYLHVGYQLSPDSRGVGVIGVLNVNSLQPTHNKQDFIMDNNYRLLITNLKNHLAMYWSLIIPSGGLTQFWVSLARARNKGKTCVQCTKCMKWRTVKTSDQIEELWDCSKIDFSCDDPEQLPPIPKLIKKGHTSTASDVERKLEEQMVKIKQRHKTTLHQLRMVKAKELATATGFPLEKCVAALRASGDNKVTASELLFSGIPIPGFDVEGDDDVISDELVDEEEGRRKRTKRSDEEGEEEDDAQPAQRRKRRKRQKKSKSSTRAADSAGEEEEGAEDENGGSDSGERVTDRQKRFLERQKQKERMLEERLMGRDILLAQANEARESAEDGGVGEEDGDHEESHEEEQPTKKRQRRRRKKQIVEEEEAEPAEDEEDVSCSKCEELQEKLQRKGAKISNLKQRIHELEMELSRFVPSTQQLQKATPAQQTNTAAGEPVLLVIKNEPDDFVEFL